MKTKYALLSYDTENIGDEIQSIAARRFLPRVDCYLNRDDLNSANTVFKPNNSVKLIMNGWYTHHPEKWPPKLPWLDPLLISIHVDQNANHKSIDAFLSPDSKKFLNTHGPVGARDMATLELFQKNKIDSYLSQCLTLTLLPEKTVKKQDFILAVDIPEKVFQIMQENTKRPIIRFDTYRMTNLTNSERIKISEFILTVYQSAHAVITMRLHTMLPCLALGTSVLALQSADRDPGRYNGLIDLVHHVSIEDYITNPSIFNLDKPPQNPTTFKQYAKNLATKCSDFTNYDSKRSYLNGQTYQDLMHNCDLISGLSKSISASYASFLLDQESSKTHRLQLEIDRLKSKNDYLDQEVANLKRNLNELDNMGIKMSSKHLLKSTKNFIKKHL